MDVDQKCKMLQLQVNQLQLRLEDQHRAPSKQVVHSPATIESDYQIAPGTHPPRLLSELIKTDGWLNMQSFQSSTLQALPEFRSLQQELVSTKEKQAEQQNLAESLGLREQNARKEIEQQKSSISKLKELNKSLEKQIQNLNSETERLQNALTAEVAALEAEIREKAAKLGEVEIELEEEKSSRRIAQTSLVELELRYREIVLALEQHSKQDETS